MCGGGKEEASADASRRGRPTEGRDTPHTYTQESGALPHDAPVLCRALWPPLCTTLSDTLHNPLHITLDITLVLAL